jgi:hypothetical protein
MLSMPVTYISGQESGNNILLGTQNVQLYTLKTTDSTDKQHSLYNMRSMAVGMSHLGREVGAKEVNVR